METNKKLIGVFIKATPENRQELKEFWEANSESARKENLNYDIDSYCYGLTKDSGIDYFAETEILQKGYKILTLPEAKALISESEYPKVMWVWDVNERFKVKSLVIGKFKKWYIAHSAESIEEVGSDETPCIWNFAKDIEPEEQPLPEIHLTMQEIADLKGCKVEQLKISK